MRIVCVILVAIMLGGCGVQPVLETVEDPWIEVAAPYRELRVNLPKDAATPVLQADGAGKLYLCDGYVLTIQTFPSGDVDATMQQLTGFTRQQLTCMETREGEIKQYNCVWSAAGEGGDHVGRAVILDDGNYHYAVSVMADFATAGELTDTWQTILGSVCLRDTD